MKEKDELRCAILDIQEYREGMMTKNQLCKYISEDLNIIAMPIWKHILIILIAIYTFKTTELILDVIFK